MTIKKTNILGIMLFIYTCGIYAFPNKIFIIEMFIIPTLILLKPKIKINFYLIRGIIFFVLSLFFSICAIKIELSIIQCIQMLKIILIGYLFILHINSVKLLRLSIFSFIAAGVILILKVLSVYPVHKLGLMRFQSIEHSFNANTIGIDLGISFLFLLYENINHKKKIWHYILFCFFLIFIFLTGSKKALILIFVGTPCVNLMYSKNKMKLFLNLILSVFGVFIFYFLIMKVSIFYDTLGYRVDKLMLTLQGNTKDDGSTLERISMVKSGILIIKQNIFKGHGFGQFPYLTNFNTYSHNNYIELFVSTGLLGVLAYYSLPVYLIIKNLKYMGKINILRVFFIILGIIFILDVGCVSYLDRVFQFYFVINYSMINTLIRKKLKNNSLTIFKG